MTAQPSRYSIYLAPFIWIALLLLASGNILFFVGWFEPIIATIASLAILGGIFYLMRRITPSLREYTLSLSLWDLSKFAIGSLLLLICISTAGFIGYFPTDWDHSIMRQAVYVNLIEAPWPVVLPNGKEFTYYIASMLPPAMLARAVDEGLRQYILLGYVYTFCLLIYVLATFYLRKVSLLLIFVLYFMADPVQELFIRFYAYIFLDFLETPITFFEYFIAANSILDTPAIGLSMGPYNSALPSLLALCLLLLVKKMRHFGIPFLIAILLPESPLGAIAIMPIALYYYLPTLSNVKALLKNSLSLILPISLVILSAAYFVRADNQVTILKFTWDATELEYYLAVLSLHVVATLILTLPLIFCKSIGNIKYLLFSPLLFFSIFFGCEPNSPLDFSLNEFYLKAVVIYTLLATLLWFKCWKELSYSRIIILLCCLTGIVLYVKKNLNSFNPSHQIRDDWNGHLNHDHPFFERAWPALKEQSPLSEIILNNSGESEQSLPGSLLLKAPGCDYSRPHNKQ